MKKKQNNLLLSFVWLIAGIANIISYIIQQKVLNLTLGIICLVAAVITFYMHYKEKHPKQ